jgi:hypothetical protein
MCHIMSGRLRASFVVMLCIPGLGACYQAEPYSGLPGAAPSSAAPQATMTSGVSAGMTSPNGAGASQMVAATPGAAQGSGPTAGTSASSEFGVSPGAGQAGAAASEAAPAAPAGPPAACNIPECYSSVLSRCLPMGECMSTMTDSNFNLCFSNGVKFLTATMFGSSTFSANSQAINPDGSPCYSSDVQFINGMIEATFRDATGAVFATTTANMETMMSTITCTGQPTVVVDREACFPGSSMMMMPMSGMMMMMCPSGTCM